MRTLAVVPSRYEPERLRALVLQLAQEVDVVVYDNAGTHPILPADVLDAKGLGIYRMWNLGWDRARTEGYDAIALLNDDIRILPGTLTLMARALESNDRVGVVYPHWPLSLTTGLPSRVELERTAGTVTTGGMTGFCFMFRSNLAVPPFDEGFGWWYGDDAFERSVRRSGFEVARVVGLPCEHESDSEANDWARRPDLRAISEQDRTRWEAIA